MERTWDLEITGKCLESVHYVDMVMSSEGDSFPCLCVVSLEITFSTNSPKITLKLSHQKNMP